jgi:putative transposase
MGLGTNRRTTVMSKHVTKSRRGKVRSVAQRLASTSRSALREAFLDARLALREVMVGFGMRSFAEMLEEDREALCGPKSRPQPQRRAYRYGHDVGRVVLGGRKVVVSKPRVRSVEGRELELPCWRRAQEEDPLEQRVLEQMLVGVSSRSYDRSLEELGEELPTGTTSRSSFSRALVSRTRRQVKEFLSRPLGELDLAVILIDGKSFGEHVLVTALGVDVTGRKHVLGLVEGTTESEAVGRRLFREMIERGLRVERARLFVIDGGKGVRKAIRETFGGWALVQRCQIHKLRNVAEHLPENKKAWVRAAMRKAWGQDSVKKARARMLQLAEQLDGDHPGAAASLREGLDETLTLIALGVQGWLRKSLYSTNAIESLQGALEKHSRNVKRWRGGTMVMRWAAAILQEAESKFRRLKGHAQMPQLIVALEAQVPAHLSENSKEQAA